ncbi:hypothetical protein FA13DRAFT_1527583 [Coprinellus micaceus]|uniref:Uncharacterized protein n=1 Tax=Coprinellus micaceus TaxID=71717 RepID=A0A4Y7SJQ8_COPMI|nr:hypothetical protein FA13DRAFT_1527583 [Coprinellus micaceus]
MTTHWQDAQATIDEQPSLLRRAHEEKLAALQATFDESIGRLNCRRNFLAPVYRLPPEVLSRVFFASLTTSQQAERVSYLNPYARITPRPTDRTPFKCGKRESSQTHLHYVTSLSTGEALLRAPTNCGPHPDHRGDEPRIARLQPNECEECPPQFGRSSSRYQLEALQMSERPHIIPSLWGTAAAVPGPVLQKWPNLSST